MLGFAALFLFGLSAPTPAPVQDDVDPVVARQAAIAQRGIGFQITGLLRITGVRGEGRTLILTIELAAEAPALLEPRHVASIFATSICADMGTAAFFGEGRVLRVQVSRPPRLAESVTVDHCPGPAGGGLTAEAFAAGLQTFVGVKDGDTTIAGFRAEANVMIVTLAFPAGASGNAPSNSEAFVQGFCARPEVGRAFFGNGLILRVETRVGDGDPVPGPPVTACPALPQADVDPLVAEIARQVLSTPPGTGDFRRIAVRGEGRTLVWQAEIPPDMVGAIGPVAIAAVLANAICAGPAGPAFFTGGRTLRVEIRPAGGAFTSATADHCTGPVGRGFTAAGFASIMQPLVGREVDGVTIASIRAEGETVILVLDGAAGWRRGVTAEMMEGALLGNFCPGAANNAFFNGTSRIRIDTLEGGREPIRGRPISSCPAR